MTRDGEKGALERSVDRDNRVQQFYDQQTFRSIERAGSIGQIFVDNYAKGQQLQMQGEEQKAGMVERRARLATESLRQKKIKQQMDSYQAELALRQNIAQTKMAESAAKIQQDEARERTRAKEAGDKGEYWKKRLNIDAFRGQVGSMWEEDKKVWTLVPTPGDSGRYYKKKEVTDKARIKSWRDGRNRELETGGDGGGERSMLDRRNAMTLKTVTGMIDFAEDGGEKKTLLKIRDRILKQMEGGGDKAGVNSVGAPSAKYIDWFNKLDPGIKDKVMKFRQDYPQNSDEAVMDYLRKRGVLK